MGAFQDRMDRLFEQRDQEIWDAHEAGSHKDDPDTDCGRCTWEARESLNVEGDPTLNGAFDKW